MKSPVRCAYLQDCYLAEAQECYGFKTDCPLYLQTNDQPCDEARFHAAMDRLIVRTKTKHDMLNRRRIRPSEPSEKSETTKSSS